ncbi:MAG: helix-turn-helix domain-containing protein [Prevotellaceae bacterium]|jgi:transcriptional regulator with XRE-family HTH domain|nr:helix-turn-helix domain-containing protein [Prevotellaceae bacterium]
MENVTIENVIKKIAAVRLRKGYSYENMADDLQITPAAYRKIETGDTKLTVERLFKISEILKTSICDLLEVGNDVLQQNNNDSSTGYQQKIENFYQESKEAYDKLLQSKEEQIALLTKILEKEQKF